MVVNFSREICIQNIRLIFSFETSKSNLNIVFAQENAFGEMNENEKRHCHSRISCPSVCEVDDHFIDMGLGTTRVFFNGR